MKQEKAYIVEALRTPVAKAGSIFSSVRADDLLVIVLTQLLKNQPNLDANIIDDVVIGCAMPEAEQGLNVARSALLLANYPQSVCGMTVNRFCASGLQAIAIGANKILLGQADVVVAGGVESMSMMPPVGHTPRMNARYFADDNIGLAYGMGITAEEVAKRFSVSREAQDKFSLNSHQKAITAIKNGYFSNEIVPVAVHNNKYDSKTKTLLDDYHTYKQDNGAREDTSIQALAKLRSVFAKDGTVTAGNSSQRSDGASAIMICNEKTLTKFNLTPLAEFIGFSVAGVAPEIMGIGPVKAIPKVLRQCQLNIDDIDTIELNEAFAAQSIAVINELHLDKNKINPNGGAISLGHPLGATGAIRTTSLLHTLQRKKQTLGMVTMCIGAGMGAAGIFKNIS